MSKIVKKVLGITLIVLGVLALITPFSPGSWLIFVGLGLLGFRTLKGKWLPFLKKKSKAK